MNTDMQPLVSIALCTYNGERFLIKQLDSLLSQDYSNIEIVIVDDGSTDHTLDIVNSYARRDSRIRYLKNEVNLGFNKNFEKAIMLTSGDYIAISDQDDVWYPNKLRLLLDNIKDNWLIFSNSRCKSKTKQAKLLDHFNPPDDYKGILLRNYVTGHTVLLRREFLKFALPFPQKGYYDWWLGFVAAYHRKIAFLDKVLTAYRVHNESVIQKRIAARNAELEEYETVTDMLTAFSGYKNLSQEDKAFINQLKYGYQLRGVKSRSIPLIKIVYNYYRELFPNQRSREMLSKLKFALKFSKGLHANL